MDALTPTERAGVVKDEQTGEWVLPGSRRPDGTWRKPRRVKEGYVPQDEVPVYENKGVQWMKSIPDHPIGLNPDDVEKHQHAKTGDTSQAPMSKAAKKNAKKRERKQQMEQQQLEEVLNSIEDTHIADNPYLEATGKTNMKDSKTPPKASGKSGKSSPKGKSDNKEKARTSSTSEDKESVTDNIKKIRNLRKKIKQIHDLKDKAKVGQALTKEQKEKVGRKGALEAELKALEALS